MQDTTSNQSLSGLREKESLIENIPKPILKIIKWYVPQHLNVIIFFLKVIRSLLSYIKGNKKKSNSGKANETLGKENQEKSQPSRNEYQEPQQNRMSKQQKQQQTYKQDQNKNHQNTKNNRESKIPETNQKVQSTPQVKQELVKDDQTKRQVEPSEYNDRKQQKQDNQQQQQEQIVQQEDLQQNNSDRQQQQQEPQKEQNPAQIEQQQIIEDQEQQNVEYLEDESEFIEKYKYLTEDDLDLLNQIANRSYKGRKVEYLYSQFIGQAQSIQDTIKQYFGRNQNKFSKQIKQLKKEIVGHINIRGDGNCFYTAFLYQYLSILLRDEQRRNGFIKEMEELSAKIQYQDIKIEENKRIVQEFVWQFQQLKTKEQLLRQMRNPDYLFYLLTIIVFRRYFAHLYHNYIQDLKQFGDLDIYNDLLTWEQECNNNEILISVIVEHFKLHITLYFIDLNNSNYDKKEYKPKQVNEGVKLEKIFLLLTPGHYQIAIPA
ncbi:unnamed protein product [Paramecium octaurelia]|uniref:OTU domain-containing protein n=1 Tax=Paramecium octaurelia TaxID=43137 RepID=A0A8S1TUC0_PAROT|nr:unnamed protein product [Paramecium octaurelia]